MIGGAAGSMIGKVHRIAARITGEYSLAGGVFSANPEKSIELARREGLELDRVYRDVEELIAMEAARDDTERIQLLTVVTPNHLHYDTVKKLVSARFHVMCEKPMTTRLSEAEEIGRLVMEMGTIFCVAHAYTGYPMARQTKSLIAEGTIGRIQRVDAQYYQGWLNLFIHNATRRSQIWRLNPEKAGPSCCTADIGIHAFHLVEYATGMRVTKVLADLNGLYAENQLDVDANILLRMENGSPGIIRASQVATGEENNLNLRVYGSDGGILWEQENPNVVRLFRENRPECLYRTGNPYNSPISHESSALPPGHPEGLHDAFANLYKGIAMAIRGNRSVAPEFPSIEDGIRDMKFIEAVVRSNREGNKWTDL